MGYNNINVVGDHLLISNYVRYDRLTELINAEFSGSNYEEINLFIDAYSMIKSIYGLDPSQFVDRYSIAACIINACAHYRNFFWTRYKVTCKIWIIFSRMDQSILEARAFYPEYGNIFTKECNPAMDDLIQRNMEVLNTLCPYIPDVQFIYSGYEPGLVIGNAIQKHGILKPNIIISKDPWVLQTVSYYPNITYVIRPIKKNGEDLSVLIGYKDVANYYLELRKVKNEYDTSVIDGSRLSIIMAASSFPERCMKSLHNITTIIKSIHNMSVTPPFNSGWEIRDVKGFCEDANSITKGTKLKPYEIDLRHNAIGYVPCYIRYTMSPMVDNVNIINLHDPDSVKRINEMYFKKVPLDLMSL
jgi:hypothetical protein